MGHVRICGSSGWATARSDPASDRGAENPERKGLPGSERTFLRHCSPGLARSRVFPADVTILLIPADLSGTLGLVRARARRRKAGAAGTNSRLLAREHISQ